MLTLTHDATVSQPVRALGIANTRRSAAAALKTRLRRQEITLREILEHPPAELERQMTWEVLLWTPGIGQFGTPRVTLNKPAGRPTFTWSSCPPTHRCTVSDSWKTL